MYQNKDTFWTHVSTKALCDKCKRDYNKCFCHTPTWVWQDAVRFHGGKLVGGDWRYTVK